MTSKIEFRLSKNYELLDVEWLHSHLPDRTDTIMSPKGWFSVVGKVWSTGGVCVILLAPLGPYDDLMPHLRTLATVLAIPSIQNAAYGYAND